MGIAFSSDLDEKKNWFNEWKGQIKMPIFHYYDKVKSGFNNTTDKFRSL